MSSMTASHRYCSVQDDPPSPSDQAERAAAEMGPHNSVQQLFSPHVRLFWCSCHNPPLHAHNPHTHTTQRAVTRTPFFQKQATALPKYTPRQRSAHAVARRPVHGARAHTHTHTHLHRTTHQYPPTTQGCTGPAPRLMSSLVVMIGD